MDATLHYIEHSGDRTYLLNGEPAGTYRSDASWSECLPLIRKIRQALAAPYLVNSKDGTFKRALSVFEKPTPVERSFTI